MITWTINANASKNSHDNDLNPRYYLTRNSAVTFIGL